MIFWILASGHTANLTGKEEEDAEGQEGTGVSINVQARGANPDLGSDQYLRAPPLR